MRLAIAGFVHETVTFLPDETQIGHFERDAQRGGDLIERNRGTNSVLGGFLAVCERHGIEPIGLVYAECAPSGPVREDAFEAYSNEIVDRLAGLTGTIDGLLIYLHGAMATTRRQDPETDLLSRIRQDVGHIPIAVAMDLHGNIGAEMLAYADIVCGFHESPHIDMGRTGARAADLLVKRLRGEIAPSMSFAKPDLVLPSIFTATGRGELQGIMAAARELERSNRNILDITIFTGFAYADVRDIGFSIVVVTDNQPLQGQAAAAHLKQKIIALSDRLYRPEAVLDVPTAVDRALEIAATAEAPVVLLEHADRMNDSTWVLQELVKRGVKKVAVPYLYDPASVALAIKSGVGSHIFTAVGGRSSLEAGLPVTLSATVLFAGQKQYLTQGTMRRGERVDLGDCAVIDADGITLILTSVNLTAINTDPFTVFGLNIEDFEIILLRSKTHFRAAYEDLAAAIIIADTPDWGPADLTRLEYRNTRPGVYPISARIIPLEEKRQRK